MSTKKAKNTGEDKFKEPFKLTVNRTGKTKSELSVQEVKPFAPSIPVIDLTPSAVTIRYQKEKMIDKFGITLAGIITLFALIWAGNFVLAGIQSSTNTSTQEQIATLQKQLGDVEGYRVYADGIKLVRENMYDVVKNNIDMGSALDTIVSSAAANGISVSTIKITEAATTTEQNICVNSNTFATSEVQIGCVSVSGSASSNTKVIDFFDEILKDKGFSNSFINSLGVSGDKIVFSGTISLTEELKITRYNYLSTQIVTIDKILGVGGLTNESLAKLVGTVSSDTTETTATPTPTPSPTESASTVVNDTELDPKFDDCKAAIAAGYGPYSKGVDAEYDWYKDDNNNGMVCES